MGFSAIATAVIGSVATAVVSSALAPKPKTPEAPQVQAPVPPPQAAVTPEQNVFKQKVGARSGGGAGDQTALSGLGGVDNSKLTLGKSTLLGA